MIATITINVSLPNLHSYEISHWTDPWNPLTQKNGSCQHSAETYLKGTSRLINDINKPTQRARVVLYTVEKRKEDGIFRISKKPHRTVRQQRQTDTFQHLNVLLQRECHQVRATAFALWTRLSFQRPLLPCYWLQRMLCITQPMLWHSDRALLSDGVLLSSLLW